MATIITQQQINKATRPKTTSTDDIKTALSSKVLRQYCYNLTEWRNLRFSYFAQHPLDELDLLTDTVTAAEDVHHLLSPFEHGKNLTEVITLLLDADNLISLTKLHHGYIHGNQSKLTDAEREFLKQRIADVRAKYNWIF